LVFFAFSSTECCPRDVKIMVVNAQFKGMTPSQIEQMDTGKHLTNPFPLKFSAKKMHEACVNSKKKSNCECCSQVKHAYLLKRNSNPPKKVNPYPKYEGRLPKYTFPDHKPCCSCCTWAAIYILNRRINSRNFKIKKRGKKSSEIEYYTIWILYVIWILLLYIML